MESMDFFVFGNLRLSSKLIFWNKNYFKCIVPASQILAGRFLIRCCYFTEQKDNEEIFELASIIYFLSKCLEKQLVCTYSTIHFSEYDQQQSTEENIEHFHVHLIARKEGDFKNPDEVYTFLNDHDKEFYKTKLQHYNAIAEQNINNLHQEAIKFRELVQQELTEYSKNTQIEKQQNQKSLLIVNLIIMNDFFEVFMGRTDKFDLKESKVEPQSSKLNKKQSKNNYVQNKERVKFMNDDFKIDHKLYYKTKVQNFPIEDDNVENQVSEEQVKKQQKSKQKIRAKIDLKKKEKEIIDKVKEIEKKKQKKSNNLEHQAWRPRKFQQTKISLNLKKGYQERKRGLSKQLRPKSQQKKLYSGYYVPPEMNVNMVASAEFTIQELLESYKSIINKKNIFFRFMNESVKWYLLKPQNLCPTDQRKYDKNLNQLQDYAFNKDLKNTDNNILLKDVFQHEKFHDFQVNALNKLQQIQQKILVNSFTGSGKSLIYQFNALQNPGLTFVLIPYISIIVDQIQKAPYQIPSITINSCLSYPQKKKFYSLIFENKVKLVYMTPETFLGEFYQELLENTQIKISMLCIDETHCAVPWDNSFRISYLALPNAIQKLNKKFSSMNFLFLTATADQSAQKFLRYQFNIKQEDIISTGNYVRLNNNLKFVKTKDQNYDLLQALKYDFKNEKPILIFCNFVKQSSIIANFLTQNGFNSFCFHGQLTEIQKLTILQQLAESTQQDDENDLGNYDSIIATISLSMGLDVAQIKGVVHYNFPKFLEIYIQQIGRAGRNGLDSECLLLLKQSDLYFCRNKTISSHLIGINQINSILNYLIDIEGQFQIIDFKILSKKFQIQQEQLEKIICIIVLFLKDQDQFEIEFYSNIKNQYILKSYGKKPLIKQYYDDNSTINFSDIFETEEDFELNKNILQYLKKRLGKKDMIKFELTDVLNKFNEYSLSKILTIFKKYNQVKDVAMQSKEMGYLFKVKYINIDNEFKLKLVNQIQKSLQDQLQIQIFKMDFFYFLCHYVSNFKNSEEAQEKFRKLVTLYFEQDHKKFKQILIKDYQFENLCPIIYVKNQKDFIPVKSLFSEFYSENIDFLKSNMKQNSDHYQTFANSIRFLQGINNPLFPLKNYRQNNYWGCLEYYSFEDYYYNIEQIFLSTYKESLRQDLDDDNIVSESDESNKKISNQFNK